MAGAPEWEEIFRTGDDVEAEMVRGLLEMNGFPVVVESKGLKALPTIFGHAASGERILRVPPDMAEAAREFLAAAPEPPEEETDPGQ